MPDPPGSASSAIESGGGGVEHQRETEASPPPPPPGPGSCRGAAAPIASDASNAMRLQVRAVDIAGSGSWVQVVGKNESSNKYIVEQDNAASPSLYEASPSDLLFEMGTLVESGGKFGTVDDFYMDGREQTYMYSILYDDDTTQRIVAAEFDAFIPSETLGTVGVNVYETIGSHLAEAASKVPSGRVQRMADSLDRIWAEQNGSDDAWVRVAIFDLLQHYAAMKIQALCRGHLLRRASVAAYERHLRPLPQSTPSLEHPMDIGSLVDVGRFVLTCTKGGSGNSDGAGSGNGRPGWVDDGRASGAVGGAGTGGTSSGGGASGGASGGGASGGAGGQPPHRGGSGSGDGDGDVCMHQSEEEEDEDDDKDEEVAEKNDAIDVPPKRGDNGPMSKAYHTAMVEAVRALADACGDDWDRPQGTVQFHAAKGTFHSHAAKAAANNLDFLVCQVDRFLLAREHIATQLPKLLNYTVIRK